MLFGVPTYVWPFLLAIVAAVAAKVLTGQVRDDPGSMPGWILYAVSAGCVVIGFATWWLSEAS